MDATKPLHIVVASTNPVKAKAIVGALQRHFPITRLTVEAIEVPSGVPDQPKSDSETLVGAHNRVRAARQSVPNADIWAGLEGGIEDGGIGRMFAFAWIVVEAATVQGSARSATFPLPESVAQLIREGTELGHAIDRVFSRLDSKFQGGAVGALTEGLMDRCQLYEHAALLAMIPLRQQTLFRQPESR